MADPEARLVHGHDAVLVLTILVQYRKYEVSFTIYRQVN